MTDPTAPSRRRSRSPLRAAALSTDDRLAELDARLRELEGEPGLRERGRRMMDRVVPPEATRHFRNAGREQLLGMRSIVDFWIRRLDAAEEREASRASRERETIEIQ